jgi:hypothetical protein
LWECCQLRLQALDSWRWMRSILVRISGTLFDLSCLTQGSQVPSLADAVGSNGKMIMICSKHEATAWMSPSLTGSGGFAK